MGLCRERDVKRKKMEMSKMKTENLNSKPENSNLSKSKQLQNHTVKPLSFEELMRRAESNSKNTLSISDLKTDISLKESTKNTLKAKDSVIRKPQLVQRSDNSKHKKGTVKIIKRNMQPKSEISDLVVLNQKKRDLRSIEQIQFELKQQAKTEKGLEKVVKIEENPEKYFAKNYSSIISNLFGYDRNKYIGADVDDDDLLDMETDYKSILAEDAKSTRIGIIEDLEEEAKEIERKRKKALLFKSNQK